MSTAGPTGNKVFAPAIFFIAFREALEASLVIGILSGMLERVIDVRGQNGAGPDMQGRALIKKLRRYVFLGAGLGLLTAFAIGAAFLAVFYTQTTDLYGRSEELWEGIFNLIAVCLITPMSLAILRADRSRAKWRKKLNKAFAGVHAGRKELQEAVTTTSTSHHLDRHEDGEDSMRQRNSQDVITPADNANAANPSSADTKAGANSASSATSVSSGPQGPQTLKDRFRMLVDVARRPFAGEAKGATAIFIIPFITTLREGLEGVVFIGGVSLGLPATSIPLPAVLGLFVGLLCGFIVFKAGSFSKVRLFLVLSTCLLLVIAAGMASRSIYYLQFYRYVARVGDAAAESGSGAGSYDALNYVWHLDCCNPEDKTNGGSGYAILNAIFGWNNTATVGSLLAYVFYWLAVISYLVASHFFEAKKASKRVAAQRTAKQENSADSNGAADIAPLPVVTSATSPSSDEPSKASSPPEEKPTAAAV